MALTANLPLAAYVAAGALLAGLIAGLYPAWYITSFPPALVLKGSFGLSPKGKRLRTVLISIQFIVSIVLIISLLFVKIQTRYMQTTPLGFDKDNIAITEISPDIYRNHREALTDRLESFPGITQTKSCAIRTIIPLRGLWIKVSISISALWPSPITS